MKKQMKNITLEISLKPFVRHDIEFIEQIWRKVFTQWRPLLKHTDTVSVMFWAADGSEILEYNGNPDDPFEWAYHQFSAQAPATWKDYPHAFYRSDPPKMTYGIYKTILDACRRIGKECFPQKKFRLGATFDIGPEFAISDFKYHRHTEILGKTDAHWDTMFIDSSGAILKGDDRSYAAYPNGIPDGTPFATFFGKQAQAFLTDLGFDYLWLSNGLGFSAQPWSTEGKLFYEGKFHGEDIAAKQADVLRFWERFRAECNFRIETRGTNMSLGIDYSTDAIATYDIYQKGFDFLPPPNSPWAALNGNYGLELMGHLSRNAVVPGDEDFLFRYYIHDPWFKNSPWYDRYEGQPHDIYLPFALSRINTKGETTTANHMSFMTMDNTYGTLPDACVVEPLPHLLKALKDAADAPAPFVWLYPAKEYSRQTEEYRLQEMFSSDWLMCDAINHAFPLSSVVATDIFEQTDFSIFQNSILVSPVPYPGSTWEKRLEEYLAVGGKVILVGPLTNASQGLRDRLGVKLADRSLREVTLTALQDKAEWGSSASKLSLDDAASIPCLDMENADGQTEHLLESAEGILLGKGKDNLYWICGAQSNHYKPKAQLLTVPKESEAVSGGGLLRHAARYFGWDITLHKPYPDVASPVLTLHRSDNGFFFSTFSIDTTAELVLSTPYGAPLPLCYETVYEQGKSRYRLPRATHLECRAFVEQAERGVLSCREITPEAPGPRSARRRIEIKWLQDATVRFFPEAYAKETAFALQFQESDTEWLDSRKGEIVWEDKGDYFEARHINGRLVIFSPDYEGAPDCYIKKAEQEAYEI